MRIRSITAPPHLITLNSRQISFPSLFIWFLLAYRPRSKLTRCDVEIVLDLASLIISLTQSFISLGSLLCFSQSAVIDLMHHEFLVAFPSDPQPFFAVALCATKHPARIMILCLVKNFRRVQHCNDVQSQLARQLHIREVVTGH